MPPLQPFVSNIPLQVAKNLRFLDTAGIPVTQMLPIGMVGNTVYDTPETGYISRIGAILSDQIDLYNKVDVTLKQYGNDISDLQEAVQALEISGTTIPNVNGFCFTGNILSPITTVMELLIQSVCEYNQVLDTPSNLTLAIEAEGASALNAMPAYSIPGGIMQALGGWQASPETIADTINNIWLSYLDARSGLDKMLSIIVPACSSTVVNFLPVYSPFDPGPGFAIYFNGYSFIPPGYTDNGSTVTIADGVGGVFTTSVNIVEASKPGADALFVGISGTPLSTTVSSYRVTVNSALIYGTNNCTKTIIHDVSGASGPDSGSTSDYYTVDRLNTEISGSTLTVTDVGFAPSFVTLMYLNGPTNTLFSTHGHYITLTTAGFIINFYGSLPEDGDPIDLRWIAFK